MTTMIHWIITMQNRSSEKLWRGTNCCPNSQKNTWIINFEAQCAIDVRAQHVPWLYNFQITGESNTTGSLKSGKNLMESHSAATFILNNCELGSAQKIPMRSNGRRYGRLLLERLERCDIYTRSAVSVALSIAMQTIFRSCMTLSPWYALLSFVCTVCVHPNLHVAGPNCLSRGSVTGKPIKDRPLLSTARISFKLLFWFVFEAGVGPIKILFTGNESSIVEYISSNGSQCILH